MNTLREGTPRPMGSHGGTAGGPSGEEVKKGWFERRPLSRIRKNLG